MKYTEDDLNCQFEVAVAELYGVCFRFRQANLLQAEYDNITSLINMLIQDKFALLEKIKKNDETV